MSRSMMEKNTKGMTRRAFGQICAKTGTGIAALLSGCVRLVQKDSPSSPVSCSDNVSRSEYEYIIVGSGAGGGPLAANLARKGHRVLLMEAGGDVDNANYRVPLFHSLASEDPEMRWDFFVRHYENEEQSLKDSKFYKQHDGVLYPRSGTLGGCTAHNAMIFVYPSNSDWDYIANCTNDSSWHSDKMRDYFVRMEDCQYVKQPESNADNEARHGFNGWLATSMTSKDVICSVLKDPQIFKIILQTISTLLKQDVGSLAEILNQRIDPNEWQFVKKKAEGLCFAPITTRYGSRVGSREYIKAVQKACGSKLTVKLNALVTRIIFDESNTAIGVEYLQGKKLYRANRSAQQQDCDGIKREMKASREVILCGGAFNTPQLLMLSGIGPEEELCKHNIEVRKDLPGVGKNLQDRYEVGVVSEMKSDFALLNGATFTSPELGEKPDPFYAAWQQGKGIYTTNGRIVSFIKRSSSLPKEADPDLFIFGIPGIFKGYYPDYAKEAIKHHNYFTWAILKAHTRNTAGTVTLRSSDPQDAPDINFRYFDEGNDISGEDLESVVEGVNFVRKINQRINKYIKTETVPGASIRGHEDLVDFVKNNAWGHHASCTCKMGIASDCSAVVDSNFRVFGTQNLRVVDASIFPKIPGFFIVSAIYMISEKASDVIHEDAVKSDQIYQSQE